MCMKICRVITMKLGLTDKWQLSPSPPPQELVVTKYVCGKKRPKAWTSMPSGLITVVLIIESSVSMPLVLSPDHWMLGPLAIDPVGYRVLQRQFTPLGPAVASQSYTHHDKEEQGPYCSPSWPAYLVRSVIMDLLSKYSQVWPQSALDTGPSLFTISLLAY